MLSSQTHPETAHCPQPFKKNGFITPKKLGMQHCELSPSPHFTRVQSCETIRKNNNLSIPRIYVKELCVQCQKLKKEIAVLRHNLDLAEAPLNSNLQKTVEQLRAQIKHLVYHVCQLSEQKDKGSLSQRLQEKNYQLLHIIQAKNRQIASLQSNINHLRQSYESRSRQLSLSFEQLLKSKQSQHLQTLAQLNSRHKHQLRVAEESLSQQYKNRLQQTDTTNKVSYQKSNASLPPRLQSPTDLQINSQSQSSVKQLLKSKEQQIKELSRLLQSQKRNNDVAKRQLQQAQIRHRAQLKEREGAIGKLHQFIKNQYQLFQNTQSQNAISQLRVQKNQIIQNYQASLKNFALSAQHSKTQLQKLTLELKGKELLVIRLTNQLMLAQERLRTSEASLKEQQESRSYLQGLNMRLQRKKAEVQRDLKKIQNQNQLLKQRLFEQEVQLNQVPSPSLTSHSSAHKLLSPNSAHLASDIQQIREGYERCFESLAQKNEYIQLLQRQLQTLLSTKEQGKQLSQNDEMKRADNLQ